MRHFGFVIFFALLGLASEAMAQKEPFKPNLGPYLPRITVHAGDISLLLRQESQWTPGRIDYRKTPMTTEKSAYDTVFDFPEVGFIGTGHLENKPEDLQSLSFFVDGKKIETPSETIQAGQRFKLQKGVRRNLSTQHCTRSSRVRVGRVRKMANPRCAIWK